jgi:hypothetical protein
VVEVDEGERCDAAARERLGGPRADAADADDGDARGADPLVRGIAVEAAQAAEAAWAARTAVILSGAKDLAGGRDPSLRSG